MARLAKGEKLPREVLTETWEDSDEYASWKTHVRVLYRNAILRLLKSADIQPSNIFFTPTYVRAHGQYITLRQYVGLTEDEDGNNVSAHSGYCNHPWYEDETDWEDSNELLDGDMVDVRFRIPDDRIEDVIAIQRDHFPSLNPNPREWYKTMRENYGERALEKRLSWGMTFSHPFISWKGVDSIGEDIEQDDSDTE